MKPYEKLAVDFATSLVEARFEDARRLLFPELRKRLTTAKLKKQLAEMYSGYASGPSSRVHFDSEFSMEDWPDKKQGDVGWAYLGIEGEDFIEAVTVIVADAGSGLKIRDIQWGRP